MSERRRLARYRLRVAGSEAESFGFCVGWTDTEDGLPAVRKQTHDFLIRLMGDSRIGGVVWRQYSGREAVGVALGLQSGVGPEMVAILKQARRKLEEFGGYLVVATAAGIPPEEKP